MKQVLAASALAAIVFAIACRSVVRSPVDEGFDSCDDPRIARAARLTVNDTGEIDQRLRSRVIGQPSYENRVESVDEATRLFANATISSGFVAMDPKGTADHTEIDAFIRGTDFAHDELILVNETVTGSDGYAGTISQYGKTALVSHSCGQSGGAAPPTANWIAVYRIPRGNVITSVGCGSCGEPVPCCPP